MVRFSLSYPIENYSFNLSLDEWPSLNIYKDNLVLSKNDGNPCKKGLGMKEGTPLALGLGLDKSLELDPKEKKYYPWDLGKGLNGYVGYCTSNNGGDEIYKGDSFKYPLIYRDGF
jgi:hypothetical protein